MTVIVGVRDIKNGCVHLAADTAAYGENQKFTGTAEKVRVLGDILVGVSGSCRVLDVVTNARQTYFRSKDSHESFKKYLVNGFVTDLRRLLGEEGLIRMNEEGGESFYGEIMVAWKDQLGVVYSDFSVQVCGGEEPYMAIGSGYEYALGALQVMNGYAHGFSLLRDTPTQAVEYAVTAASTHCPYVGTEIRAWWTHP